ncbi:hypothetical protein [Psychrobacter sp. I-STPA10]|uniref:hypothetical protein n=1 Tax=Psychrobacter sp. I-STPA10 TaxID=2585769 RepID=UPI001E34A0D9|nr:hypothetical protein [Psychrobacter sp. I-STPA10]
MIANRQDNQFRSYSRRVVQHPNEVSFHQQRIEFAKTLMINEPLQGALADMFYGCWHEIPFIGGQVLKKVEDRLQPNVYKAFEQCILKFDYMQKVSPLATRWSVLVSPSLNVSSHNLLTSSDNARQLANEVVELLLFNKQQKKQQRITEIESDFFAHCLACHDVMAFTIAWFKLGKRNWLFDKRWQECQQDLQHQPKQLAG